MMDIVAGVLLLVGAVFAVAAAVGVLRFADLYTRMHAASKAGTLGSGLMLIAIPIAAFQPDIALRAVAGVVFFLLTAPVSAHLLARAAYISGLKPEPETGQDDLKGRYDSNTGYLSSYAESPRSGPKKAEN